MPLVAAYSERHSNISGIAKALDISMAKLSSLVDAEGDEQR
jgi:hypothetical protein